MMVHQVQNPVRVFLGLGSNLGDREGRLKNALSLLGRCGLEVVSASSMYETPPWGIINQPAFLNQVVEGYWTGRPEELLQACLDVELELGRIRTERYGPRTVDLDVLTFGDDKIDTPALQIPHPRLAERAFVLVPWAEIAPGFVIPGLEKSVNEAVQLLPKQDVSDVKVWTIN